MTIGLPIAVMPEQIIRKIRKPQESALDPDQFRVAASCPPDKEVHVRGGLMWYTPASAGGSPGAGWDVDDQDVDFTDADFNAATTFANANYFQGIVIGLEDGQYGGGTGISIHGAGTEVATAILAEARIEAILDSTQPWESDFPLCGIVLKNDGTTATAGSILPIDPVNRGRSYIWRDVRPPGHFVAAPGIA